MFIIFNIQYKNGPQKISHVLCQRWIWYCYQTIYYKQISCMVLLQCH